MSATAQAKYKIPAGTAVKLRCPTAPRPREHVTRVDLYFSALAGRSISGDIWHFYEGEWLIAARAQDVERL